jgi:hypothetical protein
MFQAHKEEWTGTEVGSQNEENPVFDLMNGIMNALFTIPTETSAKLLFASVAAVCDRRIAGIFVRNGGHRPPLQLFCRDF